MNGNLMAYRVQLWACVLHVALITLVLLGGGIPWVSGLFLMGVNGPLAVYYRKQYNKSIATERAKPIHRNSRHFAELEAKKLKKDRSVYDCAAYETRVFEQRLVDAGVEKAVNMTVCEDKDCVNCLPTRKLKDPNFGKPRPPKGPAGVSKATPYKVTDHRSGDKYAEDGSYAKYLWLQRNDPRWKGYTYSDYKFQMRMKKVRGPEIRAKAIGPGESKPVTNANLCEMCGVMTPREKMCLPCSFAAAQKRDAELVKRNSQRMHGRWTEVGGLRVLRPNNVPSFATAKQYYDPNMMCDYILWTWSYDDTGTFRYKQRVDVESYEMQDGNGKVVSKWQAVYDPDTGEHLGDVMVTAKGTTELRSAPKCRDAAAHQLTGDCGCDWSHVKRPKRVQLGYG